MKRNKIFFCLAISTFLLLSIGGTQNCDSAESDKLPIFTSEYFNSKDDNLFSYPIIRPFWTPTQQIAKNALIKARDYIALNHKNIIERFDSYKFQYAGISYGNKKVVAINAFCRQFWFATDIWTREFVEANDGGACFFRAYYDVELNSIVKLEINGQS